MRLQGVSRRLRAGARQKTARTEEGRVRGSLLPPSSLVPPRLPLTAMHEEEAPRLETTASLLPGECTRTQRHPAPRFAGNDALYEQQDA